jgi:hypothetical protein
MLKATIFYSWQSDTRAAANRTLIQDALEAAAKDLRADDSIAVEPVVDRDTLAVPGAPNIAATILEKIDSSTAVVADVTIVNPDSKGRPCPNPNVLIELGHALKSLGERRLILVQNVALGGPELLPFDLRQKRVLTYNMPPDAASRVEERRRLQAGLRDALVLVLAHEESSRSVLGYPVELVIDYLRKQIRSERHDYELRVFLKNLGTKPITEWHLDVEFPTRLLEPTATYGLRVPERSDPESTLFRATQSGHRDPVYPGDRALVMTIAYRVDTALFISQGRLFDQMVTAAVYVHGDPPSVVVRAVRELHVF